MRESLTLIIGSAHCLALPGIGAATASAAGRAPIGGLDAD